MEVLRVYRRWECCWRRGRSPMPRLRCLYRQIASSLPDSRTSTTNRRRLQYRRTMFPAHTCFARGPRRPRHLLELTRRQEIVARFPCERCLPTPEVTYITANRFTTALA